MGVVFLAVFCTGCSEEHGPGQNQADFCSDVWRIQISGLRYLSVYWGLGRCANWTTTPNKGAFVGLMKLGEIVM